jgi:hypothetical protein
MEVMWNFSSATVLKFNIQLKHIRSEDITMLTQFLQTSWTKWKNPFLYILDYNWEDEALDLNSKNIVSQSSAILWAIFPKLQIMKHYITPKNLGKCRKKCTFW